MFYILGSPSGNSVSRKCFVCKSEIENYLTHEKLQEA